MDRNTVIGFLLIAAILIGWSYFTAPSQEEIEEMRRRQDSIRVAKALEDSLRQIQIATDTFAVADTGAIDTKEVQATEAARPSSEHLGIFSNAAIGEEEKTTIENEYIKATFSNKGGRIYSIELKDYKRYNGEPLKLFEGDTNLFNLTFFAGNRAINTEELFFETRINKETGLDNLSTSENTAVAISFLLFPDNVLNDTTLTDTLAETAHRSYLEFAYTLHPKSYNLDFAINFVEMQNIVAANTSYINFDWSNTTPSQEKSLRNERSATTVYYNFLIEDIEHIPERRDDIRTLNNQLKWVAFKQQFFSSIIIANQSFLNAEVETKTDPECENYVRTLRASLGLPYENKPLHQINMQFFFGPNHFNTLKAQEMSFEKLIPLGWGIFSWINRFAVIPVFNYLDSFNLNYGLIILILTVLIKIILFPIAYKTYASSAKMRLLKPDIEEINAKFPKKEDAMKKQQAVMGLYKKAGVNPMAGCLPMLLQLPILIAMFRFFPASIELRQEAFLWADDLSTYDSILDLPFSIPFYGSHVSLFTLLMTVSTIIYTKINMQMMGTSNQMPGMKAMMYMMPVMFLGIFNNFASALSYYYFLTNIITFLQMFVFRYIIDEEALKKKIEANKKRKITVKKSGFQKKLEEMAKQKSQRQKQKAKR